MKKKIRPLRPAEAFDDASSDRLLGAKVTLEDEEQPLRPKRLEHYVGQESVKNLLSLTIQAAKQRGEPLEHVLLCGPPGLGKTTLASIIAREMNANLKVTAGPVIERAADLASLLTNLESGDVLFIDEIHRLPRVVEEVLYPAMEDRKLDLLLGKGPAARMLRLDLPPFTLVGATTRAGKVSSPLRDRFGLTLRLDFYHTSEVARILMRSAEILGLSLTPEGASEIARRCRGTPRVANRLLRRVRDFAQVCGAKTVDERLAEEALERLEVDALGLDRMDRRFLETLMDKFQGGPTGIETLAMAVGEEAETLEDVYEPFLVQIGFLQRTPAGRKATPAAYRHLGRPVGEAPEQERFF